MNRRSTPWELNLLAMLVLAACGFLLPSLLSPSPRQTSFTMAAPEVVLPRDGLHDLEQFGERPGSFRWTDGNARISLPNPGEDPHISLIMLNGPQGITPLQLRSDNLTCAFDVLPQVRTYRLLLPPSTGERFDLVLSSPTVPDRNRKIGVAVSDIDVRGAGDPTLPVPLWLAAAGTAGALLLRQAGQSLRTATVVMVIAQAALTGWYVLGGWRYGLVGTLLAPLTTASLAAVLLERWLPRASFPTSAPAQIARREWLAVGLLIVVALGLRVLLLSAPDPVGDMEISARRMWLLHGRGLAGAYVFDGDYLPLRLYILRGLSELVPLLGGTYFAPLPTVTKTLLKLPGLLADLATVALIYAWARRWLMAGGALGLAALYTFAPPVWMNVAWWGQVDALLMLPLLGAVVLLGRGDGRWGWLCWAAALLIKAQAVLLAPLLFLATLRLHGTRGLLRGGALTGIVVALASLPLILAGQGEGMLQAYLGSTERFPRVTNGAYNLWYLLLGGQELRDTEQIIGGLSYRAAGLLLLAAVTLLVCWALLRRADGVGRVAAAALALAFFTLPTQIHERYLFLTLAFLALAAAADRRLLGLFLVLAATATLNILGALDGFWPDAARLIAASPLPTICAVANLAALLVLLGHVLWLARRSIH